MNNLKQYIINQYNKVSMVPINDNLLTIVINAPIKKYYLIHHPLKEQIALLLHIKHQFLLNGIINNFN
jgi:hypothetical protein